MDHFYGVLARKIEKEYILTQEPMKNHTSFKIGGPADYLVSVQNIDEILFVLTACKQNQIPCFVMGKGTNLLVSDNGYRGVIIRINNRHISVTDDCIEAGAGTLLSAAAQVALSNNLTGFEFAAGIPGTIGGALYMNAGAYGGEMKQVATSAVLIDKKGQAFHVAQEGLLLSYRQSILQREDMICFSVKIKLSKGNFDDISGKMKELNARRRQTQPLDKPSAGSTFKRPLGYYAGKLIADSGLQGKRIGGAAVSEKHAGFIVNDGDATAKDVTDLIQLVQHTVYEKFGVQLVPEVKII